ncbi:aspartate--tRNA ligase 2, cytoplasmic-like isoform X2 [Eucalyptus grandis]|uniref:aspartate--tRNA ligase 2, cytoplasmic-like isoform X2 n=1 Tax=Eucalyptus grandis TaxID=71139 RepID=UPI00192E8BB5|nr:aspartate--tRNA ligase 2, cytoplasmic-like isoform X2 [Eucalyptus grandis]
MLKDAGIDIYPLEDLNMEEEMNLGQLVREKYGTEFYILHRHPWLISHSTPCHAMMILPTVIHSMLILEARGSYQELSVSIILKCSLRVRRYVELTWGPIENTLMFSALMIQTRDVVMVISCGAAAPPHGGFRAALEDVVMSFLGIDEDTYVKATSIAP